MVMRTVLIFGILLNSYGASFLFEPYIGRELGGSYEQLTGYLSPINGSATREGKYSGNAFGALLGFNLGRWTLGGHFGYSKGEMEDESNVLETFDPVPMSTNTTNFNYDYKRSKAGIFAIYNMNKIVRLGLRIDLSSKLETTVQSPSAAVTEHEATGVGFLIGVKLFKHLRLNAEYNNNNYEPDNAGRRTIAGQDIEIRDLNESSWLISLSFPFQIGGNSYSDSYSSSYY